jgi:hypothetical protein
MWLIITISSCGHSDIHRQTELSFLLLPMARRWQDTKLIDIIKIKLIKVQYFHERHYFSEFNFLVGYLSTFNMPISIPSWSLQLPDSNNYILHIRSLGERKKVLVLWLPTNNFMFEFPCIISLYYIKNQQDATLALSFISNCKITLQVSDAFCVHHQEY